MKTTVIDEAFLAEVEAQNLKDRNRVHSSYDYIYDFFSSHRKNFNITFSDNQQAMAQGLCFGDAVFRNGEILIIKLRRSALDEIMENGGYSQYRNYVSDWKKNGYIQGDTGRNTTTSKKLGRFYKFIYRIEDIYEDEETLNKSKSINDSSTPTYSLKLDDKQELDELFNEDKDTNKELNEETNVAGGE